MLFVLFCELVKGCELSVVVVLYQLLMLWGFTIQMGSGWVRTPDPLCFDCFILIREGFLSSQKIINIVRLI